MTVKKLAGAIMFAAGAFCASAKELYVSIDDPNAADEQTEGRGSKALPYWSIQAAVDAAEAGDTVWVEPGVYTNGTCRDAAADQYPRACRHGNRVVIAKQLTLASTQGKAKTVIRGVRKLDAEYGYVGDGTVRCICVEAAATNVIIRGFTLQEGSVDNSYADISTGGGLFAYSNATLVASSVIDCAGYGAAAVDGATCATCFIASHDQKNVYAGKHLAGRSKFWNCAFYYLNNNSGSQSILKDCDAVNCTFFGANGRLPYENARLYNCVSQNFRFEDWGEELKGTVVTENSILTSDLKAAGKSRFDFLHCANPLLEDFSLMTHSPAIGAGDAKWLLGDEAIIRLPAGVEPRDLGGNDVSALSGAINAGCSQTVRDPIHGGFRAGAGQPLTLGGVFVPSCGYLFATNWPVFWEFENDNICKTAMFTFEDWLDGTGHAYLYPYDVSAFRRMPPRTPKRLLRLWQTTAHERLWVDPEAGDDENGTGEEEAPYRTLAKAGAVAKTATTDGYVTIFELKPGVYKEGTTDVSGVAYRMFVQNHGSSRYLIRAAEGPGTVTIVGSTNDTEDVGGIYATSIGCVFGVTLAGTRKGMAYRSGETSGFVRSLVTNCCVTSGSLVSTLAIASRFVDNEAGDYVVAPGQKSIAYCEFLRNRILKGGLVSGAGNPVLFNCSAYGNVIDQLPSGNPFSGGANNYLCNSAMDGNGLYYRSYSDSRAPNVVWNITTSGALPACDWQTDPLFVEPAAGDLRLNAVSPAARGGDMLSSADRMGRYEDYATVDIDGQPIAVPADGKMPMGPYQQVVNGYDIVKPEFGGLKLTGTTWGAFALAPGESKTFSVEGAAALRPCVGIVAAYADGHVETNLFSGLPGGVWTHTVDSFASSVRVEALYSPDWHVDAENGDDENDGFTPETAKKTLVGVMTNAYLRAGDTVHAAPGRYAEGRIRPSADSTVYTRVIVPAGVTLLADEGKDVTFIVGAAAPVPAAADKDGLGDDAVYCARLMSQAKLVGFTLTGGRSNVHVSNDGRPDCDKMGAIYGYGGGKNNPTKYNDPELASQVVDCDILNCNGGLEAALRGGVFIRCQILDCGPNGESCLDRCTLVNCRVRSTSAGSALGYYVAGYHSTIVPNPGHPTTRGSDYCSLFNCIVCGHADSAGQEYHGCVFATNASYTCWNRNVYASQGSFPDCTFNAVDDLKADADFRPLSPDGVQVDASLPEFEPTEAVLGSLADLAGVPRTMNGVADAGCYEWDIRPGAKTVLGRHVATVDWVSANVLVSDGTLTLAGPEARLEATAKARPGGSKVSLPATVAGGTLTAFVNGVAVATLTETGTLDLGVLVTGDRLAFVYAGDGSATLGHTVTEGGLLLLFR